MRQLGPDSTLRIQAYYDRTDREHPMIFKERLDTFDVEAQHALRPVAGHELVWGGGYQFTADVEGAA